MSKSSTGNTMGVLLPAQDNAGTTGAALAGPVEAVAPTPSRPAVRGPDGRFVRGHDRLPARRSGARPGNLNATRNPWAVYWSRRALKPADRWALALVRDYVPALVADKGGDSEVSFAERKVTELAAVARVCWALAMVAGNLDAVARFVAAERQALTDLGLERRAKPVDPFDALRAAVAEANQR